MTSAKDITAYFERKYAKTLPNADFIVELFAARNLAATSEKNGKICGALLFRKVKLSSFDNTDLTAHIPNGDCAFVVELAADSKQDIAKLEKQMRLKLGKCRHIGMHRRGIAKFYDYEQYINKLLGKDRL